MALLSAGKLAVNDTLSSEAWCRPHVAHPEGSGSGPWRLRCPAPEGFPGHCTVLLRTPVTLQAPQSLREALVIVLLSESCGQTTRVLHSPVSAYKLPFHLAFVCFFMTETI